MLDSGELNYESLMKEMKVAKNIGVQIPYYWNCLEWYDAKESGLVHYTDMPTQPWVWAENKIGDIWIKDLIDAINEDFISIDYVKDHIEKGWVRPSLLYQIENNILKVGKTHKKIFHELDKDFKAPYKKMLEAREKNNQ